MGALRGVAGGEFCDLRVQVFAERIPVPQRVFVIGVPEPEEHGMRIAAAMASAQLPVPDPGVVVVVEPPTDADDGGLDLPVALVIAAAGLRVRPFEQLNLYAHGRLTPSGSVEPTPEPPHPELPAEPWVAAAFPRETIEPGEGGSGVFSIFGELPDLDSAWQTIVKLGEVGEALRKELGYAPDHDNCPIPGGPRPPRRRSPLPRAPR